MKPDNSVYRNLKPEFELTLADNETCHVAEVMIKTDKPKPAEVRIFLSDDKVNWTSVGKFGQQSDDLMKYLFV